MGIVVGSFDCGGRGERKAANKVFSGKGTEELRGGVSFLLKGGTNGGEVFLFIVLTAEIIASIGGVRSSALY